MTLQEIIKTLQGIALTQPNIRSVGEGDIYETLNAEGSTKYAYFFITQNKHQQTEDTDRYSLNVFYIDRLEDNKENKLQIQSIGKEVLNNIFTTFCDDFDAEMSGVDFQTFTERFSDMCAGVYATVAFEVMRETTCAEYYGAKYDPNIPIKIINQTKVARYTLNGRYEVSYDEGFTGLDRVDVDVEVDTDKFYNEGFDNGYSQGESEGYGRGFSEGESEGYGQGYANGYTQGESDGTETGIQTGREQVYNEAQSLYITENGVYEAENLYNRVEVDVQGGGGSCNLGEALLTVNQSYQTFFAEDYGYDGLSVVTVDGGELSGIGYKLGLTDTWYSMGTGDGSSAESPLITPQVLAYVNMYLQDRESASSNEVYVKGTVLRINEIKGNKTGTFVIGYMNEGHNRYEIDVYQCRYIDQGTFPDDGIKVGDDVVLKCKIRTQGYQLYRLQSGTLISVETPEEGGSGNCQALIDTAIVFRATENGTYYTTYADIPEWNEPLTGDEDFYSYIVPMSARGISTYCLGNTETAVELWYRHYGDVTEGVIMNKFSSYNNFWQLALNGETATLYSGTLTNKFEFTLPANVFNKIRFTTTQVWLNDELIGEFETKYRENSIYWTIGTVSLGVTAQGDYGTIKIDDTVFIPTKNGFKNINTNETLTDSAFLFEYVNIEKPIYYDSLIKEVIVNCSVNVVETGLKFGNSTMKEVPSMFKFTGITDCESLFNNCSKLTKAPSINTRKVTTAAYMFNSTALDDNSYDVLSTYRFPLCTNFKTAFANTKFTDLGFIERWGYPSNSDWGQAFTNVLLTRCPAIYTEGATDYYEGYPFWGYYQLTNFTDFGGFVGLKYSLTKGSYQFGQCPNLTYESWKNVLNGLYDFIGNGETPASNQGKIQLHSNAYNLLTEEDIAEATAKGWTLS